MATSPFSELDGTLLDGLQFCSRVYALFENVRQAKDGPSRLRMRATDLEKKLIEELLPICKYVQTKYQTGRYISVRWINGSQGFDAEVIQTGAYVDTGYFPAAAHLEITCIMHPNEYLIRELLDNGGVAFGPDGIRRLKKTREIVSEPIVHKNADFVQSYSTMVLNQISKKAAITYPPDTTLIVPCNLNILYTPDEWEMLVLKVRKGLPSHNFREIFIYDTVSEYACTLYKT